MQIVAASQQPAQTRNLTINPVRNQPLPAYEYPGEETRNALRRAAKHFEQAIQTDPHQAENFVGLADAKIMLWCFGSVPRDDVLPQVSAAASKTVELNDKLASAHTALGIAKSADWDWAGDESELQLADRLELDRAQPRHWYALHLATMGRHQAKLPSQ